MIIDSITNCHNYFSLNTRFSTAFEYLLSNDFSKFEPGRYPVDGNEIFVMVSQYGTKGIEECKWEAHRKYIDIHLMAMGSEYFAYANIDRLKIIQEYSDEKDFLLLEGDGDLIKLDKESFIIAFPQDAHIPGIVDGEPANVQKVVAKVKMGSFYLPTSLRDPIK